MTLDDVSHVLRHLRRLTAQPTADDLSDGELLERFCRRREETAFALLVQRHGPMVLGVCRRIARDLHDAEDAFQATFLVLARRAKAIQKQASLASFLYGAAWRIALQARARGARRRIRERESAEMVNTEPLGKLTWQELRAALDEELSRLPDKYRAPVVLHYLEGKTHEQAARELGCPRTSFSSRLGRARTLLHERLVRRGLSLSAAAFAAALSQTAIAELPSALLTIAAVRNAVADIGALAAAGAVPADVVALAERGMQVMWTTKLKAVFLLVLAGCLLAAAGHGLSASHVGQALTALPEQASAPQNKGSDEASGEVPGGARTTAGVVVDSAGKPVAGADVWLAHVPVTLPDVEVLDHCTTDADGRFRVTTPALWFETPHSARQELGLIAHKAGRRIAALGFTRSSIPPSTGIRLVLQVAAQTSLRIVDASGKPIEGAQVELQTLACDHIQTDISEEYARDLGKQFKSNVRAAPIGYAVARQSIAVPRELSRRVSGRTDERGVALLPDLERADLAGVGVTADKFGTQSANMSLRAGPSDTVDDSPLFPDTLGLLPVGRAGGRLTGTAASTAKGLRVRVVTREDMENGQPKRGHLYRGGTAEVTADAQGRFEVPSLAQGSLSSQVSFPEGATVRAQEHASSTIKVTAGQRTNISIPLQTAVRIRGVVRERGSGKPVAGVRVFVIYGNDTAETVKTDSQGHYSFLGLAGQIYTAPWVPREFLSLGRADVRARITQVPRGKTEYEVPPIELTRAATLRGVVIGADGKPLPGAKVHAAWTGDNYQFGYENQPNEKTLTTNEHGEFALTGLTLQTEVRLKARHREALSAKVTVVRPDPAAPVTVRVSNDSGLALSGRVLDPDGRPIAGADVAVWTRPWNSRSIDGNARLVAVNGGVPVRTDAAGQFRTARQFDPDGDYRVVVSAKGFQQEPSPWLAVGDARPLAFPDVLLLRVRVVKGRVLDRQGEPIAGVRMLHVDNRKRVTATTDAAGFYRLEGVVDAPGFLFAQKDGFRFHGQLSPGRAGNAEVVLTRSAERVEKGLKTLPWPLAKKERLALASRVLESGLKEILERGDESTRLRTLERLARVEPARLLELIERKVVKGTWEQDYLRRAAAKALREDSPDDARAVIDAMSNEDFRAIGYCDLYDALPTSKRKEKVEILGQALLHVRAIKDGSHRLVHLAFVVKRLRLVGQAERADRLLRENEAIGRALPVAGWAGYARGVFAEELSGIDLPGAQELIKDLKDPMEYDRHHGNIAHKLAGSKPAEADRILDMLGKGAGRTEGGGSPVRSLAPLYYPVRVCYRMAPVDLERAQRIAGRIPDPYYKAHAYGVMAQALAATKPAQAIELLHRAFGVLTDQVEAGKDFFNSFYNAPVVAALLLHTAEQIDPKLVPEFLWWALSLRTPLSDEETENPFSQSSEAALALLISHYDRALARVLLVPVARHAPALLTSGMPRALIAALVAVDPKEATEVFLKLPAGSDKQRLVADFAKALALDDEERWRNTYAEVGMWFVDDEDL
jgi:RNA polymerase sigma factor (sigma-70 family)